MSIQSIIESKLTSAFSPQWLRVDNESHGHSGPGAETHFKVVLVCDGFDGVRKVARHQQVYACLAAELEAGVHALALHLYTPSEWVEKGEAPASPNCLGGSKHDKK
ncbi:MAG TPA: BolA/IbaG family iron-sulfur metabolism protein [Pseudomonadales bacterium]|nr:BolA/IbaG family iron-sulfur metabolism protein [Pseudomonadales bacterium]